jgi:phosphohistidine phosphatase
VPAAAATSDLDAARRLTLVRHAKSSWKETGQTDFERPLNARGRRNAPEMGRRMAAWSERPSLVISSAATRCVQTTQALVDTWLPAPSVVFERELYLASAQELLERVLALEPPHLHVMLVAHNPGLTDFVNRFADAGIGNLPTCAVVRLQLSVPEWSDAGWGSASVEGIESPKSPAA